MDNTKEFLAAHVKAWRGKVPAHEAAQLLGIPKRTWEGIEQGRGFRYALLLLLAMRVVNPET
jgi:hypothetical protein